jgi:hypothetical protein
MSFLQYLTGLAIAGSAPVALASTPPPPPRPSSVQATVSFADNLSDKIDAALLSADKKPNPGPYKQTFGEVWVLEWPWWQIIVPARGAADGTIDTLTPSEAFKLINND